MMGRVRARSGAGGIDSTAATFGWADRVNRDAIKLPVRSLNWLLVSKFIHVNKPRLAARRLTPALGCSRKTCS
jgi:hypothetical protein